MYINVQIRCHSQCLKGMKGGSFPKPSRFPQRCQQDSTSWRYFNPSRITRVLHGGFKLYQHLWYKQCPEKWNKGLARKGWIINFAHQELMFGWYNVPHSIHLMNHISIFRFKFYSIMQSFMISQMDFTKLMFIFLLSHQGPSKSGICKLRNCRTFLIEGSWTTTHTLMFVPPFRDGDFNPASWTY